MIKVNFESILKKNIPFGFKQPRRSQIYVGYQCHQHCGFCYYKNHYNESMFSKDLVLKQINVELQYGISDFEITGGEPSECDELEYYCQYIKTKLPTAKIAIITNGGLYARKKIWDYIDEVLVSYHISKNDNYIDKKIFPFGHTYDKVYKTIIDAKKNKKIVRTNTVIGSFNINQINLIINDLISFQPDIINFLPVNLFDNAIDMGQYINYIKLRPIIKQSIDLIQKKLLNTLIFIRYMPYCDMEGYEQHIIGTWQHIYDWFDWNPELNGNYLLEYINKYKNIKDILNFLGKYGSKSFEITYDTIKAHYEKNEKCLKCKYFLICDGVEKIKNGSLLSQIIPTYGKMIKNILYYIGNTTENFYYSKYK